ncbi:hypothetical protein HYH02_013378 [Chlamydomonas schloesseri]|uniref:Mediator of RNA polymerase II transcription subunit 10 n=1 Tax=Chlamydomonas schloesseri TaxID=2026947 RepID=A0A835SQB9_9CHLO|nr:hypothetical protein HYH02_013378 [Chlamydomonas schloesseri]|eukprot:KAG2431244.1 hypothetical protein HYH02_013378 [Chlamydomonas schloesseri]
MLKLRPAPTADGSPPRNTLEGRKAPEELIKALDGGMNPDEYLRETFRAAKRDNQISKGKAEALQLLFANLLAEATATFPVEAAEYKKLLGLE